MASIFCVKCFHDVLQYFMQVKKITSYEAFMILHEIILKGRSNSKKSKIPKINLFELIIKYINVNICRVCQVIFAIR